MRKAQSGVRPDWKSLPRRRVLAIVREFLDRDQPEGYRLKVNERAVKKEPSQWIIVVDPEPTGAEVNLLDYSHRLVDIEERILEEAGLPVFLVPVMIED